MVSQFGINMLVPIFLCFAAGIAIDRRFRTDIWALILFFIGAAAGFRNVMKFAEKIYKEPADTRRHAGADRIDRKTESHEEPEEKN